MAFRGNLAGAGIALLSIVITSVFFIDFCNMIYRCGCDHLWATQDAHCNIHTPGAKHCPWCAIGFGGGVAVWLGIVVPQGVLSFAPRRWSASKRLTAALAAFPVIGGIEGLILGLARGYWS